MDSPSDRRPLNIVFVPVFAPGHLLPLFDIARLFAARGQQVTIITIPAVAATLTPPIDRDTAAGRQICIELVHPSADGHGLEKMHLATGRANIIRLVTALNDLRPQMEHSIINRRPDCIISDTYFPWTGTLALSLGIPRIVYHESCLFSASLFHALSQPDAAHWRDMPKDADEPFLISDLPDPVTMTLSQAPFYLREPNGSVPGKESLTELKNAELVSHSMLVNSFDELEPDYKEYYRDKVLKGGVKLWNLGPVAFVNSGKQDKAERVFRGDLSESEFSNWLDSKEPNSVVYVAFGSTVCFKDEQLMEMARGLESSGHNFIWVVVGKSRGGTTEEWLPEGFEERTKERGLVAMGWAPQILILNHPSVGGFLTHCGWNSVIEAISSGKPLLTWPIHSDQFANQTFVTQVLGIGVEVGALDWSWQGSGSTGRLVAKEKIETAVRKVMEGGGAGGEMRRKVAELKVKAEMAMQEGGSSYENLTGLIEELRRIRDQKSKAHQN